MDGNLDEFCYAERDRTAEQPDRDGHLVLLRGNAGKKPCKEYRSYQFQATEEFAYFDGRILPAKHAVICLTKILGHHESDSERLLWSDFFGLRLARHRLCS